MHVVGDGYGASASRAGPKCIVVMKGVLGFGSGVRWSLRWVPGRRGQRGGDQVTLGRPSKMHRPAPAGRVDETTGAGELFMRDQDGIMTVMV